MSLIQGPCDSFSLELLSAIHDFSTDTIKMALYSSSAELGPSTTAYSATNEATGTAYSAGGVTLSGVALAKSRGVAYIDWTDAAWAASTITARGALIYNSSKSNRAIWVLNFGIDRISNNSTFTVAFPAAGPESSIIRLGALR